MTSHRIAASGSSTALYVSRETTWYPRAGQGSEVRALSRASDDIELSTSWLGRSTGLRSAPIDGSSLHRPAGRRTSAPTRDTADGRRHEALSMTTLARKHRVRRIRSSRRRVRDRRAPLPAPDVSRETCVPADQMRCQAGLTRRCDRHAVSARGPAARAWSRAEGPRPVLRRARSTVGTS